MKESVQKMALFAERGGSLAPEGRPRVSYLEVARSERTGEVAAIAVTEREDGTAYEASWSTGEGRLPSWVFEWARKAGVL